MFKHRNWPAILAYTLAILIFFVVSGYAVMYATGYRIDFRNWSIEKTGVLAVTTKPSGATITIDDKTYSRTTPFTLRNMLPGEYAMTMTLEGYESYSKTITVVSNRVTEEHNIDLVLTTPTVTTVAENVSALITLQDSGAYFGTDKKFYELGKTEPMKFENLPSNIQTILNSATSLFLASKHDSSNNWALGVVSGGKRWLLIVEPNGYRGQAFQTPLSNVTTENLYWMGADRLAFVIGQTVYGLDLTLNKLTTYHKNAMGITYSQNAIHFVQRNETGGYELWRDSNIFDAKPAELMMSELPVGQDYEILITPEKTTLVMPINRGVTGLWMWMEAESTEDSKFIKLDSNVKGVTYDYLNDLIFYTANNDLKQFVFKDPSKTLRVSGVVHSFDKTPTLLGKRNESLFWKIGDEIYISDVTVDNIYPVTSAGNKLFFLDDSSQKIWLQTGALLESILLRNNNGGIFGNLPNLWWGENYSANTAEG